MTQKVTRRAHKLVVLIASLAALCAAAAPSSTQAQHRVFYGFEGDAVIQWLDGLSFVGDAGVDIRRGWALSGENNGWIGSNPGFNAINKPLGPVPPTPSSRCEMYYRVMTSGNIAFPGQPQELTARFYDTASGATYYEQTVDVGLMIHGWGGVSTGYIPTTTNGGKGIPVGRPVSVRFEVTGFWRGNWIRLDDLGWTCS